MSEQRSPPGKRRRLRVTSRSPTPVHYIDLTADSPAPATRLRVSHSPNDKTSNSSGRSEGMDTIVIDETESLARSRPSRKQSTTSKSPSKSTAGPVIDLDDTIAQEDLGDRIPQVNDSFSGSPTVLTCPICYEDLRSSIKPTSTKCGHIFCESCIQAAVGKRKKCPVCMASITLKSCIRLHF